MIFPGNTVYFQEYDRPGERGAEWYSVSEIGGRWTQGGELIHQATFGLQRIATRWIIEGGVIHNLTGAAQTSLLISTRIRF